jgi:hypothetical protein
MIDVISTPWTIHQCLLSHKYPQAAKLIITFDRSFPGTDSDPLIVLLLRKEVKFLKLKLIKTLFVMLETSYIQTPQKQAEFYNTKLLL